MCACKKTEDLIPFMLSLSLLTIIYHSSVGRLAGESANRNEQHLRWCEYSPAEIFDLRWSSHTGRHQGTLESKVCDWKVTILIQGTAKMRLVRMWQYCIQNAACLADSMHFILFFAMKFQYVQQGFLPVKCVQASDLPGSMQNVVHSVPGNLQLRLLPATGNDADFLCVHTIKFMSWGNWVPCACNERMGHWFLLT